MAASSNDTYAGALEVLLKQIATAKTLPDSDIAFLVTLENAVLGEIRNPERQMAAAGIVPQQGQNPQGMEQLGLPPGVMPGGAGGMGAPPPSMLGAGVPGMATSPGGPNNGDEMRRALTPPG